MVSELSVSEGEGRESAEMKLGRGVARFGGNFAGDVLISVPEKMNIGAPILAMVKWEVVAPILVLVHSGLRVVHMVWWHSG